ncbi:MAG: protein kinase [Acidobacteriia bacterium]|nr:protein kinase [Terriglobia bacterium]
MPTCPRCSTSVPEPSRFCPACRADLTSSAQAATALEARPPAPRPSPTSTARPASSAQGGFAPGHVLADRHRIVGLLGRGGMGEVYRADDLKLGQAVALKFLPSERAADEAFLERFRAEVRTSRQVAHPNVCRVYDIGEADGRHFLTMEYVDGEDLSSLLHRIGKLPKAKALEVARQLCAGLAAIHDRGVLHRDLKPANVMLDGHGRVRITDFGLALGANESGLGEVAGTPAYMAPEQFAGNAPTVQTDLYALGLVLYEAYTGKRVFEAAGFLQWKEKHTHTPPTAPSQLEGDVDAAVERAVMRCLEKDPARRPSSARALAAALPGGDPLAAALAAGETPSPEMVAAAGGEGALSPRVAWSLFGAALLIGLACVLVSPYSSDLGLSRDDKSPEVLRDRAREIVARLGYDGRPADSAGWLQRDYLPIRYMADHEVSTDWRRKMGEWGSPLLFHYRQSPRLLNPANRLSRVEADDPPNAVSGMAFATLDSRGRLRRFEAVPPQREAASDPGPRPDWAALFAEAGLEAVSFTEARPEWVPPQPFDARAEWTGALLWSPATQVRVAAAAFRGKPVYFEVLGPWSVPTRMLENTPGDTARRRTDAVGAALFVLVFLAALVFARRNLRAGRGDRRGAYALGAIGFGLEFYCWFWRSHHVWSFTDELRVFLSGLAHALFAGALLPLIYLALEPYVRRTIPDLLISWARVAEGRLRDPRVGRDLLLGGVAGTVSAFAWHIANAIPAWTPVSGQTTMYPDYSFFEGVRGALLGIGLPANFALANALYVLGILFVLRLVFRRTWLAGVALAVVFLFIGWGENPLLDGIAAVGLAVPLALVATRLGLVGTFAFWYMWVMLKSAALPFDPGRWYFGTSMLFLAFVVALFAYAFRISLGNRPVFGGEGAD